MYVICGTFIDGTGSNVQKNKVLKIEKGTIVSIEDISNFTADKNEKVFDLRDQVVTPGFIDCHDHLGLDCGDEAAQCAEPDAWIAVMSTINARNILENGITTMRDCGEKNYIDFSMQKAIESGKIQGPRLLVSGHPIIRTGGHGYFLGKESDGVAEVRKTVREQLKMGADLIKIIISGGMSTKGSLPDSQEMADDEIIACIEEAHRAGRKVAAHIHGGPGLKVAVAAGADSIEHGLLLTDDDLELMAKAGTFLVSTIGVGHAVFEDPDAPQFYKDKIKGVIDQHKKVYAKARELGIKVTVGNDTNHARMDLEFKGLQAAGYTPMEILTAATRNGADLCGILDSTGTLEVGKAADLLAFNDDILNNFDAVIKPVLVMKNGVEEFNKL